MRVKAPPVKLPESKCPPRASIAIGKRVDVFKAIMQICGAENRGQSVGLSVPPLQQIKHER